MDIDGVKTKLLLWYYKRLDGPKWSRVGPPTLKGLKQVCSICPSLENILKSEAEITEKPDQQSFGAAVRLVNQVKD